MGTESIAFEKQSKWKDVDKNGKFAHYKQRHPPPLTNEDDKMTHEKKTNKNVN